MIEFGIKELDESLGGVDFRKNILISGTKFSGKEKLLYRIINNWVTKSPSLGVVYLLTRTSYNDLLNELNTSGILISSKLGSEFKLIDSFTRTVSPSAQEPSFAKLVNGPLDLTSISVNLSLLDGDLIKNMKIPVNVYDSISVLLLYNPPATTFRFIQFMCGRTKILGGISLFLIDEDMHSQQVNETIRSLVDGVIELKEENGKRYFRGSGTIKDSIDWKEISI
ncbi:MAG: ATPase domain-containing protein [Candidatus Rehaiarchaeum fermentans]|nr:hypothetical protein [Candidatus Rehaiarchaeum fermentans]MCW1297576.1 hypothetical protein [Candidatus Rehaiarchaeum fermentans]MCW1302574.1 hypothetical protein [Candidatus Rehaiarchaeum fermentans]